jgi:hypothetical protein
MRKAVCWDVYRVLGRAGEKLAALREEIGQNLSAKSPLENNDRAGSKLRDKLEDELNAAIESEYRRQRGDLLLAVEIWLRDILAEHGSGYGGFVKLFSIGCIDWRCGRSGFPLQKRWRIWR